MPNAVMHPSAQELSAFALGKLADAAATSVACHLETCSDCRQAIEKLPADSFVGKVRAARPSGSSLAPRPTPASDAITTPPSGAVPPAAPKDLPPELASYGKYRFVRELGRGGMGVVYQAEQTVMGRSVAIKVINPSVLDHPDALPRFLSEVKAAAQLDHPNIVRAHDAEQVGSIHLLVMEYVEGTSLAELVSQKGPLSVPYACHYVRQAALGLQHAFEQGMVHRDIKPKNLMVNARGQIKVLDFGLARMRSERRQGGGGLTQADAFMGTPEYVSPEQATDARSADTRADIYSLGCTLFFLLTGRPPFQEDNMVKLILAQIEQEPPAVHEVRAEVPVELSAMVSRMLAKDPAQRFQTPIEVAQALAVFITPDAKQAAAAAAPSVSSPATGTAMAADTSKIQAIRRDMPDDNAPAQEGQPFEGLEEVVASRKKQAKPAPQATKPVTAWYRRGPVLVGVGVAALALGAGVWLLAGIVFKTRVKTADGEAYVVLEIDQPGAMVTVDNQKFNVQVPGDNKPIEIKVEPGRPHQLRVSKDGFEAVTQDIELQSGKSAPIRVRLEPVKVAARREKQPTPPRPVPLADGFVSLFNGKDITGWQVETGDPGQWEVNENAIVARSDGWRNRCYLLSTKEYGDFILRLEFMVEAGGNGGIVLRAFEGEKLPQIDGQFSLWHPVVKLTDPVKWLIEPSGTTAWVKDDKVFCKPDEDPQLRAGDWHRMEITIRGETCIAVMDGKKVVDIRAEARGKGAIIPALKRAKGKIGLETLTGTIRYRNIQIKELPPTKFEAPPPPRAPEKKEFLPLFNGKDITGWKTHPDAPGDWKVEKGILIGRGPKVSHLYSQRGDYADFHLRVEAKINQGGNSGVLFHKAFTPDWKQGYEAQIDSSSHKYKTGTLYVKAGPGVGIEKVLVPIDTWFTQEVIVQGNHIIIKINGVKTADFVDVDNTWPAGHIALQVFDAPTVVQFRRIEIKELSAADAAALAPPAPRAPSDLPPEAKAAAKADAKLSTRLCVANREGQNQRNDRRP